MSALEAAIYKMRGNKVIEDNKRPLKQTMKVNNDATGTSEVITVPYSEKGSFEINGVLVNYDTEKDSLNKEDNFNNALTNM